MNLDLILLIVFGCILVGLGAWGIGIWSEKIKNKMEIKRAGQFLLGKRDNYIKVDDEKINITKFIFKNREGEIKVFDTRAKDNSEESSR